MKERKQSSEWYIAATHWLTAGFVIPLVLGLILILGLGLLFGENELALGIGIILIYPLTLWLGVMYASRYLYKTYVISNAQKIANLATIYLVVLGGGFRLYQFFTAGVNLYDTASFVLGVIVFYFASRKYIQNTPIAGQQQNQQPTMTDGGTVS